MPDLDLDRRLSELAADAGRSAPIAAADVRRRADRRRRRRYAGSAALGVLVAAAFGVGITLGQPRPQPAVPVISPAEVPTPGILPPPILPSAADSAAPWADAGPGEPIKAPPPYSAAFTGSPRAEPVAPR
jgi:hypothetical protein